MVWTVSRLGRRFGLSRSTLLYYDRIGLLCPSARSESGYRLYSEADVQRLQRICVFREAGVPLSRLPELLRAPCEASAQSALFEHLALLNERMDALAAQRERVVRLLGLEALAQPQHFPTRDEMVAVLRGAGLDEAGLARLHAQFERLNPVAHEHFLQSLGLAPAEVAAVREQSRREAGV